MNEIAKALRSCGRLEAAPIAPPQPPAIQLSAAHFSAMDDMAGISDDTRNLLVRVHAKASARRFDVFNVSAFGAL